MLQPQPVTPAPVQLMAIDGPGAVDAPGTAAAGLTGPATALPHRETIQRSFGRHDVSHVRAFVGGPAADASSALGARAYASGDATAFAQEPDLRTAAHEAAHVVQQTGGVQLAGGVGSRGDAYEQHADRVADLVVRGESAESTLSQMAAPGPTAAAAPGGIVQRDGRDDTPDGTVLPPNLEAGIMSELNRPIRDTQTRAQRERMQRLVAMFHSIAPPWRAVLGARLARPRPDDVLVARIRGELHHKSVQLLQAALRGEAVTIPPGESLEGVAGAELKIHPASLVLDATYAPRADVRLKLQATEGPSVVGPPVEILWQVDLVDEPEREPPTQSMVWPAGLATSDEHLITVDGPGNRRVRCHVVQDGLLVTSLESIIEVAENKRSGEADKKRVEDLTALMVVPEDNLQAGFQDRTQRVTSADLTDAQRKQLGDERAMFEFAASQRGVVLQRNLDPGPDALTINDTRLSADPVFLRNFIEELYVNGGWGAVDSMEGQIAADLRAGDPSDVDDPMAWSAPREAILNAYREQKRQLKQELQTFTNDLGQLAKDEALARLRTSAETVHAETVRYGFPQGVLAGRKLRNDVAGGRYCAPAPQEDANTIDAQAMGATAVALAASQRDMESLRERTDAAIAEYRNRLATSQLGTENPPSPEWAHLDTGQLDALIQTLKQKNSEAERRHTGFIVEACDKYPFLAAFKKEATATDWGVERTDVDASALAKLGDESTRTDAVRAKSLEVLDNISRTIVALKEGDLSVWKEPRIMAMAKAASFVAPGSARERAANDKIDDETSMSWTDWALLAVTVALAIVTFIPTGGGSALVAGAVLAAEVGLAVIGTMQALEALEQYQIGMAATGTDYDKAKAISASEPSLFWLAVDVIGVALDVGSAVKAFNTLNRARKAARAGMSLREWDEAIAVVHREAHQARVSAEAAMRLEDEMRHSAGLADDAADAGADASRRAAGEADDVAGLAGRSGDEIAGGTRRAAPGLDMRARVRPEDLPKLEEKLGAAVVFDDSLEEGVRVVGKAAENGDIHVDLVRVGRNATVADILAHRRTIARLTRYNGLVGSLRKMWDELVALAGGRVDFNPFPAGSIGYNSYEEVRKLQGLIQDRKALLLGKSVDPDILDEEIAFLQGEVARHKQIVGRADESFATSADGVMIERPRVGQRTAEATDASRPGGAYPLPAEHPEWYYYRLSDTRPDVYELAIKPTAPKNLNLKSFHAEVIVENGVVKPTGKLIEGGRPQRIATVFTAADADAVVVQHVRQMEGMDNFCKMLTDNGLYDDAQIDQLIIDLRAKGVVKDDQLRHQAKEIFKRDKVLPSLLDPNLTQVESFKRMEKLLGPLGVADRGNMAELWYQLHFGKKGMQHHVATSVTRLTDAGEELLEDRVIDFFHKGVAREVKSGAGAIDHDQFNAYLDMVGQTVGKNSEKVTAIAYVFTDTSGAVENLGWIAKQVRNKQLDFVSVEAFDPAGRRWVLDSADKMDEFLTRFGNTN